MHLIFFSKINYTLKEKISRNFLLKVKISFAIYEKTSVTTSISSEALKYLNRDIKTRALPTDCLESEKEGTMGCLLL